MGTDGQENSSTGWPGNAARSSKHKLYRCDGKQSCGDCRTGTANVRTCWETDDGAAGCDRLAVAGDAESRLGDDGQLDSC